MKEIETDSTKLTSGASPASSASAMDTCIAHVKEVMATQLGLIKDRGYDYAPQFRELTTQLYMLGVLWKFAEGLENIGDAREFAFSVFEVMLVKDGMSKKKAQKRMEFLRKMSQLEDGHNALAVAIGYEAQPGDSSMAEVFDHYVDDTQVSGAFWRLYERGRKTMLYGGLAIFFLVVWFITLFMPGNSAIAILASGLIAAALFVIPVFLIGVVIYRRKIKKIKQPDQ